MLFSRACNMDDLCRQGAMYLSQKKKKEQKNNVQKQDTYLDKSALICNEAITFNI